MPISPVSLKAYDSDFDGFARDVGEAFERYGFAVIADHGLARPMLDAALRWTRALFALSTARKLAYAVPGGAGQRGYTAFGREAAKDAATSDLKEFWHVGRELAPGHPYRAVMPDNLWPSELPGFRPALSVLYADLDRLGGRVLRAIARHLGLALDAFEDPTQNGNSILRLLHYPPVPPDAPGVRAGAHEDINAITLLLGAEEAGLELLDRDGRWLTVQPPPDALVCNIGDMLQRLTNDVLPSTTHRVVNPAAERRGVARYSTPFFLHFRPDFVIRTLPGCISAARPNRYPEPITADAYLRQRLREIGLA